LNSSSFVDPAQAKAEMDEAISHFCEVRSASFEPLWNGLRKDRPYASRKKLCLEIIERMLREDRCRLSRLSRDLGWLGDCPEGYWSAPVETIMATLRDHWLAYEGWDGRPTAPEGFDTTYFVMVIPGLIWPPYTESGR
jgi:hypothetical protein